MASRDMAIANRGVFPAEVAENRTLCREHFGISLRLNRFPPTVAGQFVQVRCGSDEGPGDLREADWPPGRLPRLTRGELADRVPLLRRPLSLAGRRDRPDGSVELDFLCRAVGAGTRWLSTLRPGDPVSVLGPLGNGFTIRPGKPLAVLVGGGAGIAPLLYLAEALSRAGRETLAFVGARSADLLPLTIAGAAEASRGGRPSPCVREFAAFGAEAVVASDDGSAGAEGFVSRALAEWLRRQKPWPEDLVVYCCGPEALMKAVADLCLADGIECQLALERHMACGMGTCQSCVVKVRDSGPAGWSFKLCCADGPVFDARQVLW